MTLMRDHQRGSTLIEGLASIVVFAVGMLGLAGMKTQLVQQSTNAQYRAQASYLAEELIGLATADVANVGCYQMTASGAATCSNSIATAAVSDWRTRALRLPGASASPPTVAYASDGTYTITIMWQRPQETMQHNYLSVTNLYPGS